VIEERRRAVQALAVELSDEPPRELVRELGLPDAANAQRLHETLRREWWA
jgi:hypothetical protein